MKLNGVSFLDIYNNRWNQGQRERFFRYATKMNLPPEHLVVTVNHDFKWIKRKNRTEKEKLAEKIGQSNGSGSYVVNYILWVHPEENYDSVPDSSGT